LLTIADFTKYLSPVKDFGRSFSTATVIIVCSALCASWASFSRRSSSNSEKTSSNIKIGDSPSDFKS